jgi:glutamine synthetase
MAKTKTDILALAKELKIKFIRLQFSDILGVVKNVAIPIKQLPKALDNEIMFDGSAIEGYARVEESDMNLRPDLDTFAVFPWCDPEMREARLICDVYYPNGQPFVGDPRYVLKKVLQEAESLGYSVMAGPEFEFFLFPLDEYGRATPAFTDKASYFDMAPVDSGEMARRDIVVSLEEMGFEVEASHHENAPGQHEIGFKYDHALCSADRVATAKFVAKTIARRHGLVASFMPKPIFNAAGSGMHTHLSLVDHDGSNLFYDPNEQYQLSKTALYFIGGLLRHAPGYTAITNPLVNSYKRLITGYEAPVHISWSAHNRSALVRVPASRKANTRIELRSPDPSCNPYLAFAAIIKAGLDGITNSIEPPPSLSQNVYLMSEEERKRLDIASLPASLQEAIECLKQDEVIKSVLGDHILTFFLRAKMQDWNEYTRQVHQWEIDKYLEV